MFLQRRRTHCFYGTWCCGDNAFTVTESEGKTTTTGRITAYNLYGNHLISRSVQGEQYYYLYNAHGDVVMLMDADSGAIAATYRYDAFGNLIQQAGDVDNNITYAGYQYDEETGLYYLNARYYNSNTGRFLTEDTYRGRQQDPLSLHARMHILVTPQYNGEPIRVLKDPVIENSGSQIMADPIPDDIGIHIYQSKKGADNTKVKNPARPGNMQEKVKKGQAPKEVDRVDPAHVLGQKPHVHFKDGTSMNNDGTVHDVHNGIPNPSNKTIDWLKENGWQVK